MKNKKTITASEETVNHLLELLDHEQIIKNADEKKFFHELFQHMPDEAVKEVEDLYLHHRMQKLKQKLNN